MFWKVRAMPEIGSLAGLDTQDRLTLPDDVAPLGAVDLVDAVEDRGLTGPVGTDDGKQLPWFDLKRDPIDGPDSLEGKVNVIYIKQGLRLPTFDVRLTHDSHRLRLL